MPARAMPTLLLTRPGPDSEAFATRLPEFPAVISPILRIVGVEHDARRLQLAGALVFTSGHAVPMAGEGRGRPAFCVGPGTAARARRAGFAVTEGPGDADGLAPILAASGLRLLHPHGRHVARPLPVEGMVVYDQVPQDLSPEAQGLLRGRAPVILPLFSPRSARLLAEAVGAASAPLWLVAISRKAREAWSGPAQREILAGTPDADAMVAAVRRLAGAEQS